MTYRVNGEPDVSVFGLCRPYLGVRIRKRIPGLCARSARLSRAVSSAKLADDKGVALACTSSSNGYAERATMPVSISGDAGFSRRITVDGRSAVYLCGSPERMTIRI